MLETLIPMAIPVLAAHLSGVKIQYPDLIWKELCGQMVNLVAESGGNKGQLSYWVEAFCRDFHQHDEAELRHAGLPPHIVHWIVEQFCIDIEALLRLYLIAPCRAQTAR